MHLANCGGNRRLGHRISDAPACNAVALGQATDQNRPFAHSRHSHHRNMAAFIYEVFIDLVGHRYRVVLYAQLGDRV